MKKNILFIAALLLLSVVVFAQTDSVSVGDLEEPVVPDWVSYAINAVLVFISGWLAKAKLRLGKAVVLLQGLSDALADGNVSKGEISSLVKQARELVEKEK